MEKSGVSKFFATATVVQAKVPPAPAGDAVEGRVWQPGAMRVRIVGTDLPGGNGVTVGVQRGQETVFEVPATVVEARFEFELERPFIHGRNPERFIYLVWRRDGQMFRRAKLMLPALQGSLVEARLGMTDARGGPVCAAVRPPRITWTVLE